MTIRGFDIPGLKLVVPKRFEGDRGVFQETWSDRLFRRDLSEASASSLTANSARLS
jgi:dTDP-4-dehydrorhamnose 3,5-epimerase-like enzyme